MSNTSVLEHLDCLSEVEIDLTKICEVYVRYVTGSSASWLRWTWLAFAVKTALASVSSKV